MPYNVAHGKELEMTLLWRHASVNYRWERSGSWGPGGGSLRALKF